MIIDLPTVPLLSMRLTATVVIDVEGADSAVKWYDRSMPIYASPSMSDVGLSDVTIGGHLFVIAMVLYPANKANFQTTSGRQYMITCALCSSSTDDDPQNQRRLTLKLAFCCC